VEDQSKAPIIHDPLLSDKPFIGSSVQRRLRNWEAEHAKNFEFLVPGIDNGKPGQIRNDFTKPQEGDFVVDYSIEVDENVAPLFDAEALLDVGDERRFLRPGDLVELRYFLNLECCSAFL
jgi:hypothetical protein